MSYVVAKLLLPFVCLTWVFWMDLWYCSVFTMLLLDVCWGALLVCCCWVDDRVSWQVSWVLLSGCLGFAGW